MMTPLFNLQLFGHVKVFGWIENVEKLARIQLDASFEAEIHCTR